MESVRKTTPSTNSNRIYWTTFLLVLTFENLSYYSFHVILDLGFLSTFLPFGINFSGCNWVTSFLFLMKLEL